ncbi:hypothetical protein C8J57DRAFT_1234475 [Mycena rebaudengoi]|nr:hypothetical protein C8J57DRAFT_1234475 [Mycena rebaudengoi]
MRGTATRWGLKRGRRNTESQRKKREGLGDLGDVGTSEGGGGRTSYGSGDVGGTFKRLRDDGILSWKAGAVRGIGDRRAASGDNGGWPRGPRRLQKINKKVGGGAAHRARRKSAEAMRRPPCLEMMA